MWQKSGHLLPGQRDHVQGAVHEAARHHLLGVFCEHGVIHTVVCSHVLEAQVHAACSFDACFIFYFDELVYKHLVSLCS